MKLGAWLDLHGGGQQWFAKRAGLSQSYVSRLVNDECKPRMETCARIFEATEGAVTANDFMSSPANEERQGDPVIA